MVLKKKVCVVALHGCTASLAVAVTRASGHGKVSYSWLQLLIQITARAFRSNKCFREMSGFYSAGFALTVSDSSTGCAGGEREFRACQTPF